MLVRGSNDFFSLLGVDYVFLSPPYHRVCKWGGVRDFLVFVQSNNGGCTKALLDYARNDPYGVLISETRGRRGVHGRGVG